MGYGTEIAATLERALLTNPASLLATLDVPQTAWRLDGHILTQVQNALCPLANTLARAGVGTGRFFAAVDRFHQVVGQREFTAAQKPLVTIAEELASLSAQELKKLVNTSLKMSSGRILFFGSGPKSAVEKPARAPVKVVSQTRASIVGEALRKFHEMFPKHYDGIAEINSANVMAVISRVDYLEELKTLADLHSEEALVALSALARYNYFMAEILYIYFKNHSREIRYRLFPSLLGLAPSYAEFRRLIDEQLIKNPNAMIKALCRAAPTNEYAGRKLLGTAINDTDWGLFQPQHIPWLAKAAEDSRWAAAALLDLVKNAETCHLFLLTRRSHLHSMALAAQKNEIAREAYLKAFGPKDDDWMRGRA